MPPGKVGEAQDANLRPEQPRSQASLPGRALVSELREGATTWYDPLWPNTSTLEHSTFKGSKGLDLASVVVICPWLSKNM